MDNAPRITHLSWGRMDVEGLGSGKDFALHPGGGRPWDWSEHGTRHEPGIQPADVQELLDHGCTTVVLGLGMRRRLHVMAETIELLEAHGIQTHVEETITAVRLYNELADTVAVGGLFHSTC